MRILIISHEYPPIGGGGANACMNLAREYSKAGHKVNIVSVWFEGLDECTNEGNVTIRRVRAKRKHAEHCGFSEMLDFLCKAKPVVERLVKEEDFDICQVFFGIPSGPLGLYLKRKYKLPYVIRFGGGDIPGFQDRFATIYRLIGPAIKCIWRNADALVANSSGLQEMALHFYDKKQVYVIPNGSDLNAFSVSAPGENSTIETKHISSTIKLLFVSRLIERKGLQDILPQFKSIRENCLMQGIQIQFDIVGDGPYSGRLKEIVKKEGIEDIVHFNGQKTKSELPPFYSEADIFLFPSRKEGMPNVVLEAMSYGLPIIMTPCQGSDELIQDNGIVCDVGDFNEKIIELSLNTELRKKMGDSSRNLVRNVFTWEKTATEYLKLFERIGER